MALVVGGLILVGAAGGIAAGATAGAVVARKKHQKRKLKKLRKKLFGEPIAELPPKFMTDTGLPVVVEMTILQLEETGLETEGLFRVPGSLNRIQVLADAFRKGSDKALAKLNLELEDQHDVGGVFKLYFRSMPESLCPFSRFNDFVALQEKKLPHDEWMQEVISMLNELPEVNKRVFMRLLPFFAAVCEHSDVNKMTSDNMSIVFGPTLFTSPDPDPLASLQHSSLICELLKKMIDNQRAIVKGVHRCSVIKTSKKTINAKTLRQMQKQVHEVYRVEEGEDELEEEELEAIKELLEDDIVPVNEIEGFEQTDEYVACPEYTACYDTPDKEPPPDSPEVETPPQARMGKPLPAPPSKGLAVSVDETQLGKTLPKPPHKPIAMSVNPEQFSQLRTSTKPLPKAPGVENGAQKMQSASEPKIPPTKSLPPPPQRRLADRPTPPPRRAPTTPR